MMPDVTNHLNGIELANQNQGARFLPSDVVIFGHINVWSFKRAELEASPEWPRYLRALEFGVVEARKMFPRCGPGVPRAKAVTGEPYLIYSHYGAETDVSRQVVTAPTPEEAISALLSVMREDKRKLVDAGIEPWLYVRRWFELSPIFEHREPFNMVGWNANFRCLISGIAPTRQDWDDFDSHWATLYDRENGVNAGKADK